LIGFCRRESSPDACQDRLAHISHWQKRVFSASQTDIIGSPRVFFIFHNDPATIAKANGVIFDRPFCHFASALSPRTGGASPQPCKPFAADITAASQCAKFWSAYFNLPFSIRMDILTILTPHLGHHR